MDIGFSTPKGRKREIDSSCVMVERVDPVKATVGTAAMLLVTFGAYMAVTTNLPPLPSTSGENQLEELTTEFERRVNVDNMYGISPEETKRMLHACGIEMHLQGPTVDFSISPVQGNEITLKSYTFESPRFIIPYNIAQGCLPKL